MDKFRDDLKAAFKDAFRDPAIVFFIGFFAGGFSVLLLLESLAYWD
jgi:hypothetical protein